LQPRKQRKYRSNAPLHVRRRFVSATLSDELRKKFSRRSFPLRKGDEVEIMRGKFRGTKGTVEKADLKNSKVYIDSAKRKKVNGSEIMVPIDPSNLRILDIKTEDKTRAEAIRKDKAEPSRAELRSA